MDRLDRNIRFFGADGQRRLRHSHVAIVGIGGLGSHVVQQLAYLGVGALTLVDDELLDVTNKNRYVTAYAKDAPGSKKVDLGARLVGEIDPAIAVHPVFSTLRSSAAFDALKRASAVLGCVDNDGARLVLTELCSAYRLPYFDIATEIRPSPTPVYGGRVCVALNGRIGCPVCLDLLDLAEVQSDLESTAAKRDRRDLYGVTKEVGQEVGPSVVSINGVAASLAVTEFMVWVTRLRDPEKLLTYRGDLGRVTASRDEPTGCYYCQEVAGLGAAADVERFIFSD